MLQILPDPHELQTSGWFKCLLIPISQESYYLMFYFLQYVACLVWELVVLMGFVWAFCWGGFLCLQAWNILLAHLCLSCYVELNSASPLSCSETLAAGTHFYLFCRKQVDNLFLSDKKKKLFLQWERCLCMAWDGLELCLLWSISVVTWMTSEMWAWLPGLLCWDWSTV